MSAQKTMRMAMPPMLWIHLPSSRPRRAATVMARRMAATMAKEARWFSGSHAAEGPIR